MSDFNPVGFFEYPLSFLVELVIGVGGAAFVPFIPRRWDAEGLMNVAAVVAFLWLAFRVTKRSLPGTSSRWKSFLRAALGVLLFLFLISVLTLPVTKAWERLIQGRYAFESDPFLDYTPFRPPYIARSVLKGNEWIDYASGEHPWTVPAPPGSSEVPKSAIYALWAMLTGTINFISWLLFGKIWSLITRRFNRSPVDRDLRAR